MLQREKIEKNIYIIIDGISGHHLFLEYCKKLEPKWPFLFFASDSRFIFLQETRDKIILKIMKYAKYIWPELDLYNKI